MILIGAIYLWYRLSRDVETLPQQYELPSPREGDVEFKDFEIQSKEDIRPIPTTLQAMAELDLGLIIGLIVVCSRMF